MSDEKQVQAQETQEIPKGPRGEVGKATTADAIKLQWHRAHFTLEDNRDKDHPYRKTWVPMRGAPSLKDYARKLAADGDQLAKDWLAHKSGSLNQKRSEKNVSRVTLEKQATKAAKRKTKK